jgi:hypothetical protein
MEIQELLTQLHGVRENATGWTARCPAHADDSPSLKIDTGDDGRVLVHCHAGCSIEDVVQAMGISVSDLFADETAPVQPQVVVGKNGNARVLEIGRDLVDEMTHALKPDQRRYLIQERMLSEEVIDRYRLGVTGRGGQDRVAIPIPDEAGAIRDTRRWLPPERRNRDDAKILHWAQGFGGARLFPLDQLNQAQMVLCAGELDALAAISHGFAAITATCGEGHWPDELSESFSGSEVVILLDADATGVKGTELRAESLVRHGATVNVATWPEDRRDGWDITDELREHGPEGLRKILSDAKSWSPAEPAKGTSAGSAGAWGGASTEINWPDPQPIPMDLPEVLPFDPLMLPVVLRPWVEDIATRMQCPIDFPAIATMVALAAVVGRQIGIRPKQWDPWTVVPNLWGAIIGRPGVLKTPALQEPLMPLRQLEAEAHEGYRLELAEFEAQKLVAEQQRKEAQIRIRAALKKDGGDALHHAREAISASQAPPSRRRYVVNDSTVEKLGEILNENERGILLFRDELTGFLRSMDREGHEGDRAFYLEAWNGTNRFSYDRIGRGTIDIHAACVSILGGIQPGPLASYISAAARGGNADDGFIQRFQMIVWPDISPQWIYHDAPPDIETRRAAHEVFRRLDKIDPVGFSAVEGDGGIPYLQFSEHGQGTFIEFLTDLERRIRQGDEAPIMEAHLGKFRSLIPSLALLIHLADGTGREVSQQELMQACAWGDYLESHARRVYAPATRPDVTAAAALAERILAGDVRDGFSLRDVYNRGWSRLSTSQEATMAANMLEDLGWLRTVEEHTKGRNKKSYLINPLIGNEESHE